jgi:hypothetical protein
MLLSNLNLQSQFKTNPRTSYFSDTEKPTNTSLIILPSRCAVNSLLCFYLGFLLLPQWTKEGTATVISFNHL